MLVYFKKEFNEETLGDVLCVYGNKLLDEKLLRMANLRRRLAGLPELEEKDKEENGKEKQEEKKTDEELDERTEGQRRYEARKKARQAAREKELKEHLRTAEALFVFPSTPLTDEELFWLVEAAAKYVNAKEADDEFVSYLYAERIRREKDYFDDW